jgi:uncharacterized protein YbjQ (UPF0145 family)
MRKPVLWLLLLAAVCCSFLNSCSSSAVIARNTVDVATLEEINLERDDYEIIETITASATVTYNAKKRRTMGEDDAFSIKYKRFKGKNILEYGMLRFGYFAQDVVAAASIQKRLFSRANYEAYIPEDPEVLARRWATYKLITEAKAKGADALIVPVRSSDIKSAGKKVSVVKTTVSAKAVRLFNN